MQLDNLFNALYDEQDSIQFRGKGEIFDFSVEPPAHERFAFGGEAVNPSGYRITSKCTACWLCIDACPVDVISEGTAENGGATSSSFNLCQA